MISENTFILNKLYFEMNDELIIDQAKIHFFFFGGDFGNS